MTIKQLGENFGINNIINSITKNRQEKADLLSALEIYVQLPNMDNNIRFFSENLMNLLHNDLHNNTDEKEEILNKLILKNSKKNNINCSIDMLLLVFSDLKKPKYKIKYLSVVLYNALSDRKRDNIK